MEKIEARVILEILGRPKEHILKALGDLVVKLSSEKGIRVLEQTIHEAVEVKDSKDLFTSFAEILLEFEGFSTYFGFMFAYMPANIEIISPEKVTLKSEEFNTLGNRLIQRLHDYDAIVKKAIYERNTLMERLKQAAPHLFKKEVSTVPVAKEEPKRKKKSKKKSKA